MSPFTQINEILCQQFDQPEYWSELGLELSLQLLPQLSDSDWECARDRWSIAPPSLQYRVANLAAYAEPSRAIPMLLSMLPMSSDDVYVRIVESLGEFPREVITNHLSISDLDSIKQRSASFYGVSRVAIDSVIRQLCV